MKLVVGLGNPGPRYETTRHNVGFLVIDDLIDRWHARSVGTKNQAEVFECSLLGDKALLIKPQTFMNLSGRSVAEFVRFYKCAPADMVVIHDDLDLPSLSLRFKTGGGAGGHNGLKSIDECMGSGQSSYHRVRIGIGKPEFGDVADYVLRPFSDSELKTLESIFPDIAQAIEWILDGKIQQAMNRYHRSPTQ